MSYLKWTVLILIGIGSLYLLRVMDGYLDARYWDQKFSEALEPLKPFDPDSSDISDYKKIKWHGIYSMQCRHIHYNVITFPTDSTVTIQYRSIEPESFMYIKESFGMLKGKEGIDTFPMQGDTAIINISALHPNGSPYGMVFFVVKEGLVWDEVRLDSSSINRF